MYPTIENKGDESLVKFSSSSFFIKTEQAKSFEKELMELIEKYAL